MAKLCINDATFIEMLEKKRTEVINNLNDAVYVIHQHTTYIRVS